MGYRKWTIWLLALVLATALAGCRGGRKASLQEQAVLPDKVLYENGMGFLKKHQFIKARLSFQTLINTYEDSEYLEKAKYFIAYSYLKEGGIENLIQAEQAFKDFRLFFPTSALADDAQAYIVQINMHLMEEPNRDVKYSQRALSEVKKFIQEHPNSPFIEEMKNRDFHVEQIVAMSSFYKGVFYHKRQMYRAAAARFRETVELKRFGRRDEALFLLADSLDHQKTYDESAGYYAQVVRGYPFSPYSDKAKERLRKLEKSIPEVDEKLAEENKKYYTPGESHTRGPLSSVIGLVGLGGSKHQWESLEDQRVKEELDKIKAEAGTNVPAKKPKKKSDQ